MIERSRDEPAAVLCDDSTVFCEDSFKGELKSWYRGRGRGREEQDFWCENEGNDGEDDNVTTSQRMRMTILSICPNIGSTALNARSGSVLPAILDYHKWRKH